MDWTTAQPNIISLMAFSQVGPIASTKPTPTLNNKYSSYFKYFWNREETTAMNAAQQPPTRLLTEGPSQDNAQEVAEDLTPAYMKSLRLTSDQLVTLGIY